MAPKTPKPDWLDKATWLFVGAIGGMLLTILTLFVAFYLRFVM